MQSFEFDVTVKATTEKEALAKMNAITAIMERLTTKELTKLADIIQNDPQKTALAKQALGV